MPYRNGSFYKSLLDRVDNLENAPNNLTLSERVQSLETWRGSPFPSTSNVSTTTNNLSVSVVGIDVMAASGTKARLEEYGNKINTILDCLRTKGLMAN